MERIEMLYLLNYTVRGEYVIPTIPTCHRRLLEAPVIVLCVVAPHVSAVHTMVAVVSMVDAVRPNFGWRWDRVFVPAGRCHSLDCGLRRVGVTIGSGVPDSVAYYVRSVHLVLHMYAHTYI